MKESAIVAQILTYLNSLDKCYAEKTHGDPFARRGRPDISGCWRGRRIEIEVKRPGEKPSPLQLAYLERWEAAGALAFWADSIETVKTHIDGHQRIVV